MDEHRYWLMRGALCIERFSESWSKGFDTNPDAERELAHVERMLGGRLPLEPYWLSGRREGESTQDWMVRAEAELLAEAEAAMAGLTDAEIEEILNDCA